MTALQGCWLSAPAMESPGGLQRSPQKGLGLPQCPSAGRMARLPGGWAEWFSAHVVLGLVSSFGMSFFSRSGYTSQRWSRLHGGLPGLEAPAPVVQGPAFPVDILSCTSATAAGTWCRAQQREFAWITRAGRRWRAADPRALGGQGQQAGSGDSVPCWGGDCRVSNHGGLVNS